MGEKLKVKVFTQEERAKVRNRSAFMLPDNPSQKGLNANQIKRTLYEPLLLLFDLVEVLENKTGDEKLGLEQRLQDIIDELTTHRIGLLKIGNYNSSTGEIELIADATVVDDLSYDEHTGEIKISY